MEERRDARLTAAERTQFTNLWNSLGQRIESLMQGNSAFIDISPEDYERLLAAVRKRVPFKSSKNCCRTCGASSGSLVAWSAPSTCSKRRARSSVRRGRRSKSSTTARGCQRRRGPPFGTCSRMSSPTRRITVRGQRGAGSGRQALPVWLSAGRKGEELVIEVRDDGRGLDWKRIEARAREAGLPHGSRQALVDALMTEGFTLKSAVTEISGRGVGMAAVRSVVHSMGGRIEVESEPGRGTAWRFRFQLRIAHDPGKAGSKGPTQRPRWGPEKYLLAQGTPRWPPHDAAATGVRPPRHAAAPQRFSRSRAAPAALTIRRLREVRRCVLGVEHAVGVETCSGTSSPLA